MKPGETKGAMRWRPVGAVLAGVFSLALVLAGCGGDGKPAIGQPPEGVDQRIEVELRNFEFRPDAFAFDRGQTIQFVMDSVDIRHTFTVEALGFDWNVRPGKTTVERFTFERPGSYRLTCTIPGHAEAGMVGRIIVR